MLLENLCVQIYKSNVVMGELIGSFTAGLQVLCITIAIKTISDVGSIAFFIKAATPECVERPWIYLEQCNTFNRFLCINC